MPRHPFTFLSEQLVEQQIKKEKQATSSTLFHDSNTTLFFHKLYVRLQNAIRNYTPLTEMNTTSTKEKEKDLTHFPHIPSILAHDLRKQMEIHSHVFIYTGVTTGNRHVNVQINGVTSASKRRQMVRQIAIVLHLLIPCSTRTERPCMDSLTVVLFAGSRAKQFPEKQHDIIGREHVNSAYTTSCPRNGSVVIFRKEEWLKVFIHEMFHCLGLDFADSQTIHTSTKLKQLFRLDNLLLSESFAEVWARIINVGLATAQTPHMTRLTFTKLMSTLLLLEEKFAKTQAQAILCHFGNISLPDIIGGNSTYQEETNVFCYYFIPWMLLNQFDLFASFSINLRCMFSIYEEQSPFLQLVEEANKFAILYCTTSSLPNSTSARMSLFETNDCTIE